MKVSEGKRLFMDYQSLNSKKNTLRNYQLIFAKFCVDFGEREIESITTDEILTFLNHYTEGTKQSTKRLRYSLISSFFNFVRNSIDPTVQNPCDNPILKKIFRHPKPIHWKILEKEVIDEIIFRTIHPRNRLMLELMARAGMRVGEVLKLRTKDIEDRKLILSEPKSGRQAEVVFITQKLADRLKEYIKNKRVQLDDRIFPITYTAARVVVKKAGELVSITLRPHDLRRFAATYASRSGTPIEIVSKIILRHSNLSTTQRYLGKISDAEAMK